MAPKTVVFRLFAGVVACGEHDPELRFRGWPIINGTIDTRPEHQAVVAIEAGGFLCSATMITKRVLLTAAHCATEDPSSYVVIFGNNISSSTRRYVTEKWVHPRYNQTYIRNDIALMRLSQDVPSSVTPIPHLPRSLAVTQSDITNRTLFDFVGFGLTDPNDDSSAGTKMMFTDYINYICSNESGCSWPNPASSKDICQDQNPSGLCNGDSGGPAIVNRGGQLYVAGVSSYVGQGCVSFGCSTKVDEYETDINNFIGGVLGSSCTDAAQCDSGICVDGVCCENDCPGACKACNVSGNLGYCVAVSDGTQCSDGNFCNGLETCQSGVCTKGTPPECVSPDACHRARCDQTAGCVYDPLPDGTLCSDGSFCNGEELCQGGVCSRGSPPSCDDGNFCTADSCNDAQGGCLHVPLADGTNCGTGPCGPAECRTGNCVPLQPPSCDDQNPCTEDWCDAVAGCVHGPLPDGFACGECRACLSAQCQPLENCQVGGGCGCAGASEGGKLWFLVLMLTLAMGARAVRKKW